MNKLIFSLLLLFLVLPLFIFAQPERMPEQCTIHNDSVHDMYSICPTSNNSVSAANSEQAICCLLDTIVSVTNWIFYVLTMIVTIMVIYGGFNIVTSSGDPKKMETGRKILTFALIGLALALLAKFLPSIVKFFLGL